MKPDISLHASMQQSDHSRSGGGKGKLLAVVLAASLGTTSAFAGYANYSGLEPHDFSLLSTKWEPGPGAASFGPFGTPGSATWSIMGAGLGDVSGFDAHGGALTTSLGSLGGLGLPTITAMITSALGAWDSVSGFTNLGMVADGGGGLGAAGAAGGVGDIRIGAIAIDGVFSVLAHNYQPGTEAIFGFGGSIAGDMHIDNAETWVDDALDAGADPDFDLYTVMLHELGHALGLGHSLVVGSVMEATYAGGRRTLHADDIAGIQAIYGVPEPGVLALLGIGLVGLASRRKRQ